MKQLDRIVLRDLFRNKSRALLLIAALSVAFLVPAGLELGLKSLIATRDGFTQRLGLADLEVRLLPEDVRNFPNWAEVPGVERVEQRLLMPGTIEQAGKTHNALMIFLDEAEPRINRLEMREGRNLEPTALGEGVVERSAETYLGLTAGSRLLVKVGHQTYEQDIVGVAASPEFLMVAANPEFFLPEKGSLAVVYTSLNRVYENLGFKMVNDLLFKFAPGVDVVKTKQAILEKLGSKRVERVIAREEHISFKHIAIDYDVFRIFQPAIALVLTMLAAALVVISFDRIVRRQRHEFGALKALGYTGWELTRAYLAAGLLLGLLGAVLGAVGAIGFRTAFLNIYANAHGLAYLEQHVDPAVLLWAGCFVVAVALISAVVATWRLRSLDALALMRPAMQHEGAVKRRGLIARLPLWLRLGLNNIRRSPKLASTTMLSVGLSIAVGVSYLVCLDSMNAAIARSFDGQPWSHAVSFLYPTLQEEYAEVASSNPNVQVEGFVRSQGTLKFEDRVQDASLLGVMETGKLRHVNLAEGRMPRADGEIVVGVDLARKLGLGVGARLFLELRNQRHPMHVVGLKSDVVLSEAVLELATLQRLLELEDQATGMFVATPAQAVATVEAQLRQLDFVGRVTQKQALVGEFKSILQDIRKLVLLVALIALAVAVVFIAANLSMTMNERAVEFSTLWALGCETREARGIAIADGIGHALGALVVATPATFFISRYLNALASKAWFDQPTFVSPVLAIAAVIATLALTAIGAVMTFRSFWAEDQVQRLRARAIQ